MSQGAPRALQCVKCSAPLGTAGGRCPFCGTVQPETVAPTIEPATVGLSEVNRARLGRPTLSQPRPSGLGPAAWVAAGVLVGLVGLGVVGVLFVRRQAASVPGVALSASAAPIALAPTASATMGGIAIIDATRVDPTDYLPKIRKRLASWDAEPQLVDIVVNQARGPEVDLTQPGAQIVYRFASSRKDPRAPKGQERREGMQVVLRQGGLDPEPVSIAERTVNEPNCIFSAAFRAAVGSGLPAKGPLEARYGYVPRLGNAAWSITSPDEPGPPRELDAMSCAIKGR